MKMNKQITTVMFLVLTLFWLNADNTHAQTTAFTYQGSLKNGTTPATGNHDFEFVLFDQLGAGGVQLIPTIFVNNVPVTDGIFSVKLDFGNLFPGANRFLEIRVRQTGGGAFTLLTPRQQINSTPYSVKSLNAENATTAINATQLGGVTANQFVQTTDTRLSDARNPLPNSANYIQNTTPQQTTSNFNISGTGNAAQFNAVTQYNINGNRVLSVAGNQNNIFAGILAGQSNTTGTQNSFFGIEAGQANTTGQSNSFFGNQTGQLNITGTSNSFFGSGAGFPNSNGSSNSFFGGRAGFSNTTGSSNSFFGNDAGDSNITGGFNTIIGVNADVGSNNLTNATAIGSGAIVSASNSVVLGNNANVGIDTSTPLSRLDVRGNVFIGLTSLPTGDPVNSLYIANDDGTSSNSFRVDGFQNNLYIVARTDVSSPSGAGIIFRTSPAGAFSSEINRFSIDGFGNVTIEVLASAGSTQLCRNGLNQISTCSSSIRYKSNINAFSSGLDLVKSLRPVSFNWRADNQADLGLVAEEVAEVEPLLVTRNDKGEVEGVKYDRLGVVLLNAVKEQQTQIEQQKTQIEHQQQQIDALTKLVCASNPTAEICKENQDEE